MAAARKLAAACRGAVGAAEVGAHVWQRLERLFPRVPIDSLRDDADALVKLLLAKMEHNAFVGGPRCPLVLLSLGSFYNHSCAPNAVLHLDSVEMMATVKAIGYVERGEELCIAYTPFPIDDAQRRDTLLRLRLGCPCACDVCQRGDAPSHSVLLSTLSCWQCGAEETEGGPPLLACPSERCRAAYCSPACRRANWPLHSRVCTATALCWQCAARGAKRCAACHATYCSPECQRAHWPLHRRSCQRVKPK